MKAFQHMGVEDTPAESGLWVVAREYNSLLLTDIQKSTLHQARVADTWLPAVG